MLYIKLSTFLEILKCLYQALVIGRVRYRMYYIHMLPPLPRGAPPKKKPPKTPPIWLPCTGEWIEVVCTRGYYADYEILFFFIHQGVDTAPYFFGYPMKIGCTFFYCFTHNKCFKFVKYQQQLINVWLK